MRPLTNLQRQRITLNLFIAVALGAVATVAAPALFPCPAFDNNDKSALLEQSRKFRRERGQIEMVVRQRKRRPVEVKEGQEQARTQGQLAVRATPAEDSIKRVGIEKVKAGDADKAPRLRSPAM